MSLTFHFLNIFFQCLSVSNLGSCSQLENLFFSSSEMKIMKLRPTLQCSVKLRFRYLKKLASTLAANFNFLFTTVKINTEETRASNKRKRERETYNKQQNIL